MDPTLQNPEHWSTIGKWAVGILGGVWAGAKVIIKIGEQKRRYEELHEDVRALREEIRLLREERAQYITTGQQEIMAEKCHATWSADFRKELAAISASWRNDLNDVNANLYHFMLAMNVTPRTKPDRRHTLDLNPFFEDQDDDQDI